MGRSMVVYPILDEHLFTGVVYLHSVNDLPRRCRALVRMTEQDFDLFTPWFRGASLTPEQQQRLSEVATELSWCYAEGRYIVLQYQGAGLFMGVTPEGAPIINGTPVTNSRVLCDFEPVFPAVCCEVRSLLEAQMSRVLDEMHLTENLVD